MGQGCIKKSITKGSSNLEDLRKRPKDMWEEEEGERRERVEENKESRDEGGEGERERPNERRINEHDRQ